MIPLVYTLRKEIFFEKQQDIWIVISETPLNVLRVSERAACILQLCDGSRSIREIAETTATGEEWVFRLCNYFHRKAILEIAPAGNNSYFPNVTVLIPIKNRAEDLVECLKSVVAQDYPKEKMEIIVVDDGSEEAIGDLVHSFPCRVLTNPISQGPSHARNLGVREAKGEILAFLDSDCVAGKTWLYDLVVYFQWERVGAVGGNVDGYSEQSALARYEKTFSPLHIGNHILYGTGKNSRLYAPTCNLLVRKSVFDETGGMKEDMHIGEDVDFCWRMQDKGYDMFYIPAGTVKHKHRADLGKMLKRRFDYGTSEALLYRLYSEKKKTFQAPIPSAVTFLALSFAQVFLSIWPLFVAGVVFACEAGIKMLRIHKTGIHVSRLRTFYSVVRSHFSFVYSASFHLLRYYLILLLFIGILSHSFWIVSLFVIVVPASVDYAVKRPHISFPTFIFFYVLDHMAYQIGVFVGCLVNRSFRSYVPRFYRKIHPAL